MKAERTISLKSLGSRRVGGGTQQGRIRGAHYPPRVISSLSPTGGIPWHRCHSATTPTAPGDPAAPGLGDTHEQ